jgi:hypothetical protein
MLRRAQNRLDWYRKWKVGQPYHNRNFKCLEIRVTAGDLPPLQSVRVCEDIKGKIVRRKTIFRSLLNLEAVPLRYIKHTLPKKLAAGYQPNMFQRLLSGWTYFLGGKSRKETDAEKTIRLLSSVIIKTLNAINKTTISERITIIRREDESLRVFHTTSVSAESYAEVFADALGDLLAPLSCQKYFIRMNCVTSLDIAFINSWGEYLPKHNAQKSRLEKNLMQFINALRLAALSEPIPGVKTIAFPVPGVFCKRKREAEKFCSIWRKEMGSAALVSTSELLLSPPQLVGEKSLTVETTGPLNSVPTAALQKALPLHAITRELWE